MRFRFSSIVLELATAAFLVTATGFLVLPTRDSVRLIDSENGALDFMEALADAERRLIESREDRTPGFLPEVHDLLEEERRNELHRTAFIDPHRPDGRFMVGVARGYCYVLYLTDPSGTAIVESGGVTPSPEFWMIYAWPERYGKTGRRLFFLDSFGHSRYWDNPLGHYSGSDMAPSAALARTVAGDDYPLKERMSGWEKTIRWDPVVR